MNLDAVKKLADYMNGKPNPSRSQVQMAGSTMQIGKKYALKKRLAFVKFAATQVMPVTTWTTVD